MAAARAALGKKPAGKRAAPEVPASITPRDFYTLWQPENPGHPYNSARRYRQVVGHLDAYQPAWPVLTLTRKDLLDYLAHLAHLAALGLVGSTVSKHIKFCASASAWAAKPCWPGSKAKCATAALPRYSKRNCASCWPWSQATTTCARRRGPVHVPNAALAARLRPAGPAAAPRGARRLAGPPGHAGAHPSPGQDRRRGARALAARGGRHLAAMGWAPAGASQKERNRRMNQLARVAQLSRPFVRVQYVRGEATEEVSPLYKVITTQSLIFAHTGRSGTHCGCPGSW